MGCEKCNSTIAIQLGQINPMANLNTGKFDNFVWSEMFKRGKKQAKEEFPFFPYESKKLSQIMMREMRVHKIRSNIDWTLQASRVFELGFLVNDVKKGSYKDKKMKIKSENNFIKSKSEKFN